MVDHMASCSVCPVCSGQFITHHYVMFSALLTVDKCQLDCCDNWGSMCVKHPTFAAGLAGWTPIIQQTWATSCIWLTWQFAERPTWVTTTWQGDGSTSWNLLSIHLLLLLFTTFLPLELSYCAATDYKYSHLIVSLEIIFFFVVVFVNILTLHYRLPWTFFLLVVVMIIISARSWFLSSKLTKIIIMEKK